MDEFPHVHFRYFVKPSRYLNGTDLDFGHELLMTRRDLGKEDALKVINDHGARGNGREFLDVLKLDL